MRAAQPDKKPAGPYSFAVTMNNSFLPSQTVGIRSFEDVIIYILDNAVNGQYNICWQ